MNKLKKLSSVFLAVLLCFGIFAGFPLEAKAASQMSVGILQLPRPGDPNRSGWGNPALTLMNGWHLTPFNNFYVKGVDSPTGQTAYCIEPGVSLASGDSLGYRGEDFWDNYPSGLNPTIPPYVVKAYMGRILQYGWSGYNDANWNSADSNSAHNMANLIATQVLIWETVVGERDANFNHVNPSGANAVLEMIYSNHPLRGGIIDHYNRIVTEVQNHTKRPSFSSGDVGSAPTHEMSWDGTKLLISLNDSNGVLGSYSFSSTTPGVNFSYNGNRLDITISGLPSSDIINITANKTSNATRKGVIVWTDGVLSNQDNGQKQDLVTYGETVSDPVSAFFKLKIPYGTGKVVKSSEDGVWAGFFFTLVGNGLTRTSTTGADGVAIIDKLLPGKYTVTETPIDRYVPPVTQEITIVANTTSTVTFNNVLKRGSLKVMKNSEDGLNAGVKFHLYGTSLAGLAVNEYAVTDASGVASFNNVLISGNEPYILEEVDTAIRYVVPLAQGVKINWNEVTGRTVQNILKKFRVTVTKTDVETGAPQGDAKLGGAVYGIYKGETLIDRYTTDANGQFTTKYYVCGDDWSIREIMPSEGYLLDSTVHHVGAEPQLYTVELNTTTNAVTEQVLKGNMALIKHTDDGSTQIETPEEGATFEVYLKKAGSYGNAKESERDILTCDPNGFAQSKQLPYGTYVVHQTSGWEGRELMPDFEVYIAKNGHTYRYILNNANFASFIKIVKVDAETGVTIPYAGAGFQIYRPDGSLVSMTFTYPTITTIDTFYTNAEGTLVTPEKLEYGTGYWLVEVEAPYGYVRDSSPVYFDVVQENSEVESGITLIVVEKPNMPQKGNINISKTGEIFATVQESDGVYQPVYQVSGLAGAVYEVVAAEDIYTLDGTLRASAGDIVDTITTDKDGLTRTKELYLGRYIVTEITAPDGMVLNGEPHEVELVYAGQEIAVTETDTAFYNERQKVEIDLAKNWEQDELFSIGQNGEWADISFGLFAAEELTAQDGSIIPADGLIEILLINENGLGFAATDLPFGSYYLKELSTHPAYLLNEESYPVVFEYAGQDVALVSLAANEGETIENDLMRGSVAGIKKDENGDALAGALIGLFSFSEGEFTEENALVTTVSEEDGAFAFENIPYGSWFVREIAPPEGYVLSEDIFPVEIAEHEQMIEIEITNIQIRGDLRLLKVDADFTTNHLAGAVFEVWQDTNGDGKWDAEDVLLGITQETAAGIHEMKDLVYGTYFVREKKAPDKFVADTTVYTVKI